MEYYHKSSHKNVQEQLENERAQKKKPKEKTIGNSKQLSIESSITQTYSSKLFCSMTECNNSNLSIYLFCLSETSLRRAQTDKALLDMIVIELLPVSIMQDRGFQHFLQVVDHKYVPPSRRTIMRERLPILHESKRRELIDKLADVKWLSFTTDLWTSNTTMGYITVTCHYVSKDWVMESAALTTSHAPESHTIA